MGCSYLTLWIPVESAKLVDFFGRLGANLVEILRSGHWAHNKKYMCMCATVVLGMLSEWKAVTCH